ncbi:hypothetical protein JAAARDRAFT_321646 [Jaapia argillacea MUCL 33604]|uniref:Uncharacterized protein n=1 Tax=Jaapia argillacea MUCL 33604 TaxID=933084 RepID=A0A067PMV7_9AGAM|nr:hypothetical protein JAAARDRAFT_321646 [Jaapia argillacea MUCL 33604]
MITAAVTAGTSHDFHVYGWFQNGMEDLRVTPLWHSASGSELSGDIPSARFDCGVAYSEGKFILWGGHTGTNRDSRIINELDDRVYILDTVRGTWTSSQHRSKYPSQPTGRWGHSATMVGRKFTVFGGQFLHQLLDHLWVLDMESGSWDLVKPRPGFPKPAARLGHSCVAQSDEIFIFGGTNGRQCFKDLWKFNFDDRQWSELSPSGGSPPPRHGHAVALLNGVLYILGGRDGDDKDPHPQLVSALVVQWLRLEQTCFSCMASPVHVPWTPPGRETTPC